MTYASQNAQGAITLPRHREKQVSYKVALNSSSSSSFYTSFSRRVIDSISCVTTPLSLLVSTPSLSFILTLPLRFDKKWLSVKLISTSIRNLRRACYFLVMIKSTREQIIYKNIIVLFKWKMKLFYKFHFLN